MARGQAININFPSPVPQIELSRGSQWKLTERVLTTLPDAVRRGYDSGVNKFSRTLLQVIKRAIATGTPPKGSGITWQPTKRGNKPYYIQGEFYRSIGLYKYKSRTLVGMPINIRHRKGLTLNQLAILLENGSPRIPARPLWRPAYKAAGGNTAMKKVLLTEIRKSVIRRTSLTANQIQVRW